jgi:hypothetical protein
MRGAIVALLGGVLLVGCGGATSPEHPAFGGASDAATDGASVSQALCSWPDSLNDAGPFSCAAERALVECDFPSGGGCFCLLSGPSTCACDVDAETCRDLCDAGEYGVECGGFFSTPPDANVTPPAGCRVAVDETIGPVHYCCPCQ